MDNNIKVSLIIPVYNFAGFILETLKSAVNQTWKNLEIIVIDDGSTDNSADIVRDFIDQGHSNIRLISQPNQGVSVARNTGIENASGEYICFSDADDLLSPDYVEYLVGNALKYNAEVSIGTGIYTNYQVGNLSNASNGPDSIVEETVEDAIVKMLTYWYPIGCVCRAFKKTLLDKGIRFIPGQTVGEGFTFNIKALMLSRKVVVGNKPIYCYRRDNNDSCMTDFKIERAHIAVKSISIIRSLFDKPSKRVNEALEYAEWHTKGDMFNWMILSGNSKKYPKEYYDYLKAIKSFSRHTLRMKLTRKERLKSIMMWISPVLMARLLLIRKKI